MSLKSIVGRKEESERNRVKEQSERNRVKGTEYRSYVGILLYLATGLSHAQHCIGHLSTGMSSPTKQLKDV